jgi:hypothetical protein
MGIYSLGSGKMVDISVPENSAKNNLPMGTVLMMNGYGSNGEVIIENKGINERFAYYGTTYKTIELEKFTERQVSAHELNWLKDKKDNRIATYITDKKVSGDEILDLLEKAKEQKEAARVSAEKNAADREARRQEAIKNNPDLQRADGKMSSHALGAKNIKKELKKKWPTVKFSVKSKSFSGGDDISVSWTDGPRSEDVSKILDKYEEGSFDGMTDCYDYNHENIWPDIFGGAKYVMGQRDLSNELAEKMLKKACAEYGEEYRGLDAYYTKIWGGGNIGHSIARQELGKEEGGQ